MSTSLSEVFTIYRHPSGRREMSFVQMGRIADELGLAEVRDHCTMASAHERSFRTMAREYAALKNRPMNPRLTKLDPMIDRLVGAIQRGASNAVTAMPGKREAQMGQELLEQALPKGAVGVTTLNYYDQSSEVDGILDMLEGRLADHVRVLGIGMFVTELRTLNNEFREILAAEPRTEVTYDQVRASDELGQEHLLQAMAMVLGLYPTGTDEHVTRRTRLLAPVMRQNDLIREYLRARRAVRDVDPVTGEELVEPAATDAATPAAPDAPAAGTTVPVA